jgi:iron complex outermembrane receptor protein
VRRFATAIFVIPPLLANAAAAQSTVPEEIVVSGYRPLASFELDASTTVFDTATIKQTTISNFEELVPLVPNMSLSGEGSRARYFQIRGVGEREQYEGAPNPSVGYIIDDIDLSGIGGITTSFDLEQIDVLHGPQSARYGSSALAGIVYVQSAMPSKELHSLVEMSGGSDDLFSAGGAVGGPLSDQLDGRVSIYHYKDNGFRRNSYLGQDDTNSRNELTARGKLNWNLGDDWAALLSTIYVDFDNGYDAWSLANTNVTESDGHTPAVIIGDPALDIPEFSDLGKDTQTTKAGSLKISGPLTSAFDLVSITGYADSDIEFSFDSDWANSSSFLPEYEVAYGSLSQRDRNTASQELRMVSTPAGRLFANSTDWATGVYVQRLKEDNYARDPGTYIDFDPFSCPEPGCSGARIVDSTYEANTYALFGIAESALTEKWQLSVGLRFERWDADYKDLWFNNNLYDEDFNPIPVDDSNRFSPNDNMLGGHAALSYDWRDDRRSYVRIARGFKAGGFNPSLSAFVGAGVTGPYGTELVPYEPEYIWNYELGLKGLWLDGLLQGDVSIFYMDRDDAQLSQSDQLDNPSAFIYVTSNGAADSYGLEASGVMQLSAAWQLHGALGLLESNIDNWSVRPSVEGRELAHAPPYTLNFGLTWTGVQGWFVRTDLNAVGAYYFDISHDQKSHSYEVVNVRLGRQWSSWEVSIWGRNIFDKTYATRGFYFVNEPPYTQDPTLYKRFGDPRLIGLTFNYRY